MSRAWLRGLAWLGGSLGLHVAALAALPTLFPESPATPLFVDLSTLEDTAAGPVGKGSPGDAAGSAPTASPPRGVGIATARTERPSPPTAARPAAPPPAISPATAEAPATPEAPPTPPPIPAPAVTPTPSAPLARSAEAPMPGPPIASMPAESPREPGSGPRASSSGDAERPVTGGARDSGAGTRSDAPGEGGSGPSGTGGSPLALARPGTSGGVPPEYAPYLARFRQRVEEALVYPLAARRQGRGGRVELDVLLDPSGRVTRVDVVTSSTSAALDEAAVDAVKSLAAVPFPAGLPRRPLLVRLPLVFQLR